jgi:uncharacterized phiE125 gp8 family phage protein
MALNLDAKVTGDGNRQWGVTTAPTEEPITVSEVKTYARIDGSAEDTMLASFIKSVRQATELYLGRALITQTLTMSMDYWPGMIVKLPRPPLVSITEVRTVDEDGTTTAYAASKYMVRTLPEPGQLVIKNGVALPTNDDRYVGGFEIEYVAGYGDADSVPEEIKEAMKFWVAMIYENRVPIAEVPDLAKTLMSYLRILAI